MKVRRPRLFTVISFISLVLCLALCVVWWRSRRITVAARPSTANLQKVLAERMGAMNFNNVTLLDGIDFLRDVTGAEFEVDWEALEAAKIDRHTIVAARFNNATFGEVLNSILSSAGSNTEFKADGGTVRISMKGAPWRDLSVTNSTMRIDDSLREFRLQLKRQQPPPLEPVFEKVAGENRYTLVLDRGSVKLWRTPRDPAAIYQQGVPVGKEGSPDGLVVFERGGVSIRRSGSPFNSWAVALPFWLLMAITAICPLLWLRRALRRKVPYRCTHCGYDLRATPDLCPECGKAPASISATASVFPPA
jgi:hypothetical protein